MNENGSVLAEGYTPPTPADMHLPDFFQVDSLGFGFGKQMLLVILSVVVVSLFFMMAARKRAMVPVKPSSSQNQAISSLVIHLAKT